MIFDPKNLRHGVQGDKCSGWGSGCLSSVLLLRGIHADEVPPAALYRPTLLDTDLTEWQSDYSILIYTWSRVPSNNYKV